MNPRTVRVEGVVQVVILLAIGAMAAAASFTHVHNVAAAHGQAGWLAWADAVVLELMSIATGLEIRRRHRSARPVGFVLAVLVSAVALSLAAQVVEAEPSVVGWLAAALPALGFLACVKLVLTRTTATPATAPAPATTAADLPVPVPVDAPVPAAASVIAPVLVGVPATQTTAPVTESAAVASPAAPVVPARVPSVVVPVRGGTVVRVNGIPIGGGVR